jgi:hypothetical protein
LVFDRAAGFLLATLRVFFATLRVFFATLRVAMAVVLPSIARDGRE